jgi:hypothetical protein
MCQSAQQEKALGSTNGSLQQLYAKFEPDVSRNPASKQVALIDAPLFYLRRTFERKKTNRARSEPDSSPSVRHF